MTSKSTNGANGKKPTVIVFGRDADDKPRAGVFIGKVADAARQAAGTLPLRVLDAMTPDSQTLAAKTPPGRMQDDGKPFLPYVPRDLYDQIVTIASAQPHAAGTWRHSTAGRQCLACGETGARPAADLG